MIKFKIGDVVEYSHFFGGPYSSKETSTILGFKTIKGYFSAILEDGSWIEVSEIKLSREED